MNRDAAGVDISLRRAGDLVILEGRADLTSLSDSEADVSLSVAFPGEVTSTNGDQISSEVVEWKLRPGRREHDERPGALHRSQRAVVHRRGDLAGGGSMLVAGIVGWLAYASRDRSPRPGEPQEQAR